MSTKFVIHPAGGLPPARTLITNFVLSLFSGLDMLYIYIIYNIYIYIYIYILESSARFARASGPGPWWALPWALPWALGPPLGSPLGPGGALRGSGPAGPWALVGPSPGLSPGPWALPWALAGPLQILKKSTFPTSETIEYFNLNHFYMKKRF